MAQREDRNRLPAMPAIAAATIFARPGQPHTDSDGEETQRSGAKRVKVLMPNCFSAEGDEAISPLATD